MKTKRLIAVFVPIICLVLTAGSPCHAQLFGGGGLLGGGGGGGLLGGGGGFGGGGGRLLGGGGFGGGGRLLGGGGGFGGGGGRPILGGGAPIMRPSRPIFQQPIARPSFPSAPRPVLGGGPRPIMGGGPARPILGNRPVAGSLPAGGRPILGNRPIGGDLPANNRPALGDGPLAGNRPIAGNLPAIANRPVINAPNLPGVVRPSQPVDRGRLNDFLSGADRPAAGTLPRPGVGDRPLGGDRPIGGDGPGLGGDRPILGNRPGIGGDRPILDRPIMPNLGEQILGEEIHKEILGRRVERAVRVRDRVRDLYYRENHPFMYWRTQMWAKHPVWSWWRVTAPYRWANWSSVSSWCGYSGSYTQPVTYEYTDQGVYANDKEVVVDDEYSKQARELATAGAELLQQKIDAQEADKLEWLPVGVYALCKSDDGDPTMFLQITISREAIVAGSFANTTNNENLSVQGGADRESARLAVTIGDKDDVVIETGLYNLTEEQSSALVHYQDGTRENWLLVKTEEPQGKKVK